MRVIVFFLIVISLSIAFSKEELISFDGGRVYILDLSDPFFPLIRDRFSLGGVIKDGIFFENMAFVLTEDSLLRYDFRERTVTFKKKITLSKLLLLKDETLVGVGARRLVFMDSKNLKEKGKIDIEGFINEAVTNGSMIFIACGEKGLYAVDPSTMKWIWRIEVDSDLTSLDIDKGILAAVGEDGLFFIADISSVSKPKILSYIFISEGLKKVKVSDKYAVVSDDKGQTYFLDISDPANPEIIKRITMMGKVKDIEFSGNEVYLGLGDKGIIVIDVSNKPKIVGAIPDVESDGITVKKKVLISIGEPGKVIWKVKCEGEIRSTPAVDEEGNVYVTDINGYLYAIDPFGNIKWKFKTSFLITAGPSLRNDLVFFGGWDDYLYAVNKGGKLVWRHRTSGDISQVVALHDDFIVVCNESGYVYALNYEDKVLWTYTINDWIPSKPVIDEFGNVYFGGADGYLYSLTSEGKLRWKFKSGGWISSGPSLDAENVYFGNVNGKFFVVKKSNGKLLWVFDVGEEIISSPVMNENIIAFGGKDGFLYVLNKEGKLLWKFKTSSPINSSPAISKEGYIYFGCSDGTLYSLTYDGKIRWKVKLGKILSSSPIVVKGRIYVGSVDGFLYAISDDTKGASPEHWSLYHHDEKNTGTYE